MVVRKLTHGRTLAAAALIAAALPSWAQVKVIDSTPVAPAAVAVTPVQPVTNAGAEIFSRMQLLEQEVLSLRGLVEQQAFEIKRLKQQRLDDYTDLDQRIAAIVRGDVGGGLAATANGGNPAADPSQSVNSASSAAQTEPPNERELYSDALNLLLQKKDFDGSFDKLSMYLEFFPQGLYAPNAHYWLGEISLSKQDLESSKTWFSELIDKFPGHGKVADAKFKLGKVYFQLGDNARAKTLLAEVANGGSTAAQLAQDFIAVNGL